MLTGNPKFFHLHLVSDATGETLTAMSKAVTVQYPGIRAIEHIHPLVRTKRQLNRVCQIIEAQPGIVLHTIINTELSAELDKLCSDLNIPSIAILNPILQVFGSYLGAPSEPTVGGQHSLDAEYFSRIDALNFTLMHDDGQLPENLDDADLLLIGISRTSKTPTSIYLANKGYKTTNLPLVPLLPLPEILEKPTTAFIVGLIASADRIAQVRQNRVIEMGDSDLSDYVDRDTIAQEITFTRRLCSRHGWPIIDVTRRSIEETAAAVIKLYSDNKR
ncbi:MAG: pyruvate, water dikinase regulatory protein [Hyphomicrobiales bacterium]